MLLTLLLALNVHAACEWRETEVGALPVRELPEASGAVFSQTVPGRLYHINDSGNNPTIYWTDISGRLLGSSTVDTRNSDIEDLGYGPCGGQKCLYIADIGDNSNQRRKIKLKLVEESRLSARTVPVLVEKDLVYPDGSHNAEALSVHPITGDVFILTKDTRDLRGLSRMYRLRAAQVMSPGESTLEPWGNLDLSSNDNRDARLVTGMAFHPTGAHLFVLTYKNAIAISADFSRTLGTNGASEVIPTRETHQQEAIAATLDGRGFIITTETKAGRGPAPILKYSCQ